MASVGFEVMSVLFNPSNENYLAVCGVRECRVLTLNSRDEVADQLPVELALDGAMNVVLHAAWLPGSQVRLGVIATQCAKVFDLSKDALSPVHYFTLLEDSIREAVFVQRAGATVMLLLSATGMLFSQPLSTLHDGPCIITDTLHVPAHIAHACGASGASLYYSYDLDLLFVSYIDGKCVALRLNATFSEILGGFSLNPSFPTTSPSALTPAHIPLRLGSAPIPHNYWVEVGSARSLVCLGYAPPGPKVPLSPVVGVVIGKDEVKLQFLKSPAVLASSSSSSSKSSTRVEGMTAIGSRKQSVLVLLDDGSLHRYDPVGADSPKQGEELVLPSPPPLPAATSSLMPVMSAKSISARASIAASKYAYFRS